MSNQSAAAQSIERENSCALEQVGRFPGLRVLWWQGSLLYASRGYTLLRAKTLPDGAGIGEWEEIGRFQPRLWRRASVSSRWTSRLFRDGFHALAVLPSGTLVASVPGAVIVRAKERNEFVTSHRITRGMRPLRITPIPDGRVVWGEYFDNPRRDEVRIFSSRDDGTSWEVVHTFRRGEIRHVHNIVYDAWGDYLWILTGDYGKECRILRASLDFKHLEIVFCGHQHARAAAMVPTRDAVYFSTDTPLERNHIFRLDRSDCLTQVAEISSSSIFGCRVENDIFFSTMVEPSAMNRDQRVHIYGGERTDWARLLSWEKDFLPMRYFQYGNAVLPDGENTSGLLAITTIAVKKNDCETTLWKVGGTKSVDH